MNKVYKLIGTILIFVVFFTAAGYVSHVARDSQKTAAASITDDMVNAAPEFTVYDEDGNSVSLSDFRDSMVVIYFWASWNPQCVEDLDAFETAYTDYGDQVEFLIVNMTDGSKETMETAKAFLEGKAYTFPVYFDRNKSAYKAFSVRSIPATYFIDRELQLVARANGGTNTAETLTEGLDLLLGGHL